MNRMIALFQRRADEALKNYTLVRARLKAMEVENVIPQEMLKESGMLDYKATKHAVELQVWQKAADLLRKEELNK